MSYEKVKQAKMMRIGLKQTLKAIELNVAQEVIIADDADPQIIAKVTQLCTENNIPICYVDSMKKLGKTCGIDVGAATVALEK